MSKKVLFVATVVKGHIMVFHIPYLKMFKELGYEVHVAAKNDFEIPEECVIPYCDKYHNIEFERFPFEIKNLQAYKELKKLISEEQYDIIHCHTPVGGTITRLAARKARRLGTKVIYTAHGFHFYKGAPLKNWLLYYPVEKVCSYFTDVLITINKEDYALAQKKMKAKRVEYVPGVGIDVEKFKKTPFDKKKKRDEISIPGDALVLISVGELSKRKNHEVVIKAISQLHNEKLHYVIAGRGELLEYLKSMSAELDVEGQIHFLGYRTDIAELYSMADLCCFPSIHEGLPVALMEAMACGMPVACSNIRGNTDLIDKDGGVFFRPHNIAECGKAILDICSEDLEKCGAYNAEKVKKYSVKNVGNLMHRIYFEI